MKYDGVICFVVFTSQHDLLKWARRVAYDLCFVIIILRPYT